MIEHPFTRQELARCINAKDILRKKILSDASEREKLAGSAAQLLAAPNPFDNKLRKITLRGKPLVQFLELNVELISRLIAKNIKSNCRVHQSNRKIIVGNLVSFLTEGCPYNVYRFDLKNFFESIDRKQIVTRLLSEIKVPRQAIIVLHKLFAEFDKIGVEGLPRGLGISSLLAEYVLEKFDDKMRTHKDVFYYARFVDDMVFVTSNELKNALINQFISENLPSPLVVHAAGDKVASISVPGVTEKGAKIESFNYLGYSFALHSTPIKGFLDVNARRVDVEISAEKLERMKARLISSFTSYLYSPKSEKDFRLLKDRIRALTGNYEVQDPTKKIFIKTGIYYNYSEKTVFDHCSLSQLDGLFRGLLFSRKHSLSQRIQHGLTLSQRRELIGYSFTHGYLRRRHHSFDYKNLKIIKGVWRR